MKKSDLFSLIIMLATLAGICACGEKGPETPEVPDEQLEQRVAIGSFTTSVLNTYYLWNREIKADIEDWSLEEDPIEAVQRIRYKDASGKDIDKWTLLTEDIEAMRSSTAGVSTTYGFEFKLYYTDASQTGVCMVVTLTYPDSPAEKAGFKRGDVITKINGSSLNVGNYRTLVYDGFLYAPECTLSLYGGKEHTLSAVEMYENPVLVTKVFEAGGKKIGYLFFNRFTLAACDDLVKAGKYFCEEGIDDLILDMRYNGGGYVLTETLLASMLAPWEEVEAGSVFETAVYNDILAEAFGEDKSTFVKEVTYTSGGEKHTVSVTGANPGIKHLYAILTGDSASASESILVGLMPYLDVKIFGQQSYGKYCTGIMYSAQEWFEDYKDDLKESLKTLGKKYAQKWGMYVMISRYADKDGNTPCMPDGFKPDYPLDDNPSEPYQLGDPREAMLAAVLSRLGYTADTDPKSARRAPARALGAEIALERDPVSVSHILLP